MDVHVDEAGQDRLAGRSIRWRGRDHRPRAAAPDNGGDPPIGDHHHRLLDQLAGQHVDHSVRGDDHGLGGRGSGGG
jgi:hypothetical protein